MRAKRHDPIERRRELRDSAPPLSGTPCERYVPGRGSDVSGGHPCTRSAKWLIHSEVPLVACTQHKNEIVKYQPWLSVEPITATERRRPMTEVLSTYEQDVRFNSKERARLAVLDRRLEHLQGDHPERRGDPAYPPGEAAALAWVLSVIRGTTETFDLRMERMAQQLRVLGGRVATIEQLLEEDEESR